MRYEEIYNDMRCPECGHSGSLQINVTQVQCSLEIDGSGVHVSRYLGSRVSPGDTAKCPACNHSARVSQFSLNAAEQLREEALWRDKAEQLHGKGEDLRVDPHGVVSRDNRNGSYVQALAWVPEWRTAGRDDEHTEVLSEIDPSEVDWCTLDELDEDTRNKVRDWLVATSHSALYARVVEWTLSPGNLLYIVEDGVELPNFTDKVFMPSGRLCYAHEDNACDNVREVLPDDPRLHAIADAFDEVQQPYDYTLRGALEIYRHTATYGTSFECDRHNPHWTVGASQPSVDPNFKPYATGQDGWFNETDRAAAEKIKALMLEYVEWLMERYRDLVDQQIIELGYRFDKQGQMAVLPDSDSASVLKVQ